MRVLPFIVIAAFASCLASGSEAPQVGESAALPARFDLPEMKTSIYIGSVTLSTGTFTLRGDSYAATYEARVFPWAFWNESGSIVVTISPEDYARLRHGETIEISGEARNHRGKLREVSARARPADATHGEIKVRIAAGGTKLIFNGTYDVAEEDLLQHESDPSGEE